jgi:glycine dehydrogenase subunit 1
LHSYTEPVGIKVTQADYDRTTGQIQLEDLKRRISQDTCGIYVENPSHFGFIEEQVDEIARMAHNSGALFVVGVDPTSLGVLRPPGDYDADIVIGEAQPLGNAMNFGGPLLGIMATREDLSLVRQMPGRIIGLTASQVDGRRGFCMALQTREQHIRRERATSNICSNEALCAVASAVYMALMGKEGMRELGEAIALRANYTLKLLSKVHGVKAPLFRSSHFKEFTVNFDNAHTTVSKVNAKLLKKNIQGGRNLSADFPELGQTELFCVTEMHTAEQIEELASAIADIVGGE